MENLDIDLEEQDRRQREADKESKKKKNILTRAYKEVFSGQAGELVLADLIDEGFVFKECFYIGDSPQDTAYRLGRRSIVLMIKGQIDRKIES